MEGDDGSSARRPPLRWRRTVAVQALLCLALYAAFSIPEPRPRPTVPMPRGDVAALGGGGGEGDVYFLSVSGGARPPTAQARLLKQMENMAKTYQAKFVLDVAQSGEEDAFWQNGSLYFQALKIPWYSTTASKGQIIANFVKKIKMPYEQALDIIGLDTGPPQVESGMGKYCGYSSSSFQKNSGSDLRISIQSHKWEFSGSHPDTFSEELLHEGRRTTIFREQIKWLKYTLAVTNSNWRIVVGFDPLMICDKTHTTERMKLYESFRRIFVKHSVNVYLSTKGCGGYLYRDRSVLFIGIPGPGDQTNEAVSGNTHSDFTSEIHNGFFLHRVSPLEIESRLIDTEGKVVLRSVAHQNGRGAL